MKQRLICYCFLFLFTGSLHQLYAQSEISINRPNKHLKGVSEARSLSVSNTILPLATGIGTVAFIKNNTIQTIGASLAVYGIVMGPSSGNFYAEDYSRGTLGTAVRFVGAYLMKNATSEIFGRRFANSLHVDNKDVSLTDTKILIGEGLIVGSMIYSFLTAKKSVEEYNNSPARFTLNVTPSVVGDRVSPMLTAHLNL